MTTRTGLEYGTGYPFALGVIRTPTSKSAAPYATRSLLTPEYRALAHHTPTSSISGGSGSDAATRGGAHMTIPADGTNYIAEAWHALAGVREAWEMQTGGGGSAPNATTGQLWPTHA